jgi:hypothetical protein
VAACATPVLSTCSFVEAITAQGGLAQRVFGSILAQAPITDGWVFLMPSANPRKACHKLDRRARSCESRVC